MQRAAPDNRVRLAMKVLQRTSSAAVLWGPLLLSVAWCYRSRTHDDCVYRATPGAIYVVQSAEERVWFGFNRDPGRPIAGKEAEPGWHAYTLVSEVGVEHVTNSVVDAMV